MHQFGEMVARCVNRVAADTAAIPGDAWDQPVCGREPEASPERRNGVGQGKVGKTCG